MPPFSLKGVIGMRVKQDRTYARTPEDLERKYEFEKRFRELKEKAEKSYVDQQLDTKAPAGYGYGGTVIDTNTISTTTEAELETILTQMLSQMAAYEAKQIRFKCSALGDWSFCGTLFKTGDYYGSMNAFAGYRDTVIRVSKSFFNSEWCPIEWDNPLMLENKEYRTTERWNGKAVYTKVINCGKMPNNTNANIGGLTTSMTVIDYDVVMVKPGLSIKLPYFDANGVMQARAVCNTNSSVIQILTKSDLSSYTGYATIKYTKN